MALTASKHINNFGEDGFCTTLMHYVRPARGKDISNVEMYGLLSVKSETDIPGEKIAKFAWDGVVDGFEYSKSISFNESLKSALQESTRRLKQLVTADDEISKNGIDINFSIFVFNDQTVYIGILGENEILVYKNGRVINITEMLIKKNAKTAGLLFEPGDLLFAGTKGVLKENMSKIIGQKNSDDIKKNIEVIGNILQEKQGLVTFEIGKEKSDESKLVDDSTLRSKKTETMKFETSDYIPFKDTRSPFHIQKSESDLKTFFERIGLRVRSVLKKILAKIQPAIKTLFYRVSLLFSNALGNLKKKVEHKRFFKKVSAKVSQNNIDNRKNLDKGLKGFKIDEYKKSIKRFRRVKIVLLIVLGIVLLVLGIKFTIDQKEAMATHKQANGIFLEVEDLVNKAEGKVYTDRSSTETYLFKALNELQSVPQGLNEEDTVKKRDLENKILGLQDDLYKRVGMSEDSNIESYIDTRLAFGEGSRTSDIGLFRDTKNNEYLLLVDTGLKSVFRVSLYNKEVKKIPDTNNILKSPKYLYVGESGIFVFDSEVGVVKAKYTEDGWFEPFTAIVGLGINSLDVDDPVEFAVLTVNDNVYILDKSKKTLLKSTNFGSGYGLSFSYILDDSFETANDVFSDLSVYILTSGSDGLRRYIYSYTEQKQVYAPIEIVGVNGDFKNLAYGYTQGSLDYSLYVFDSDEKRFLKFEKPKEGGGEILHPNQLVLERQYTYRGTKENVWNSVHDFVVDLKEEYIYILDGLVVWKGRL